MSDYVKAKVLRLPLTEEILNGKDAWEWFEEIERTYPELTKGNINVFNKAPTESDYLDYVLEYSYGEESGDYGFVWELTDKEKHKFDHLFRQIIPNVDIDKIHKVVYCFYNCSESPDYYEIKEDC